MPTSTPIYERIAVTENRLQRYGTQFIDGKMAPLENPTNVDACRRSVGLSTMAEYLQEIREHGFWSPCGLSDWSSRGSENV